MASVVGVVDLLQHVVANLGSSVLDQFFEVFRTASHLHESFSLGLSLVVVVFAAILFKLLGFELGQLVLQLVEFVRTGVHLVRVLASQ